MAVYAAHLTRTLQGTPTVFQVAAQEALGSTVKPALRKLVEYLAAVYPDKCGWTVDWYDELYLVFDCCLQYHYLKHYAASFSESFYGLVRAPLVASAEFGGGARLSAAAERGSLALLVLLPYLRDRAERLARRWRERDEDGQLGKSAPDRLRRAAVKVHAILHLVGSAAALWLLARYAAGGAGGGGGWGGSPQPALALLRLTLRAAPPPLPAEYSWGDLGRMLATGNLGSAMLTFPMLGGLALRCVEYGAFLVQFLRWWESRGALADAALPPPPPPERSGRPARWRNRCPLCARAWRAPAVLPASGLAYCYKCISRHLRTHRACPVTRIPASEHSLIRMYVDD